MGCVPRLNSKNHVCTLSAGSLLPTVLPVAEEPVSQPVTAPQESGGEISNLSGKVTLSSSESQAEPNSTSSSEESPCSTKVVGRTGGGPSFAFMKRRHGQQLCKGPKEFLATYTQGQEKQHKE